MTTIRSATSADISLILSFIQKKSEFDRTVGAYSEILQTNEAKIRATLFGSQPFAYVLFAETASRAVGFALYAFRYSSFVGQPSIWLDDLYVNPDMRSRGVGTLLMNHLAQLAREYNCTHIAWTADARNDGGIRFYNKLGAAIVEKTGDRLTFNWRLSEYPLAATD